MAFEPRAGKRATCVKEHRTKVDHADFKEMLAQQHPDASAFYWSRTTSTLIPWVHIMKLYLLRKLLTWQRDLNIIIYSRRAAVLIWPR